MAFVLIYDKPGEPPVYLGTAADLAGDSDDISAALPNAQIGTIVQTACGVVKKQLDPEGNWSTGSDDSTPDAEDDT